MSEEDEATLGDLFESFVEKLEALRRDLNSLQQHQNEILERQAELMELIEPAEPKKLHRRLRRVEKILNVTPPDDDEPGPR